MKAFEYKVVSYSFYHPEHRRIYTNAIDFLVHLRTGLKLVQTVPAAYLRHEPMIARIEAMEVVAAEKGFRLEIWTERELFGTSEEYREAIITMLC